MELKCERLSRQFRDKKAVDQVSFTIASGVHALLGANGSGKTTLIRISTFNSATSLSSAILHDSLF